MRTLRSSRFQANSGVTVYQPFVRPRGFSEPANSLRFFMSVSSKVVNSAWVSVSRLTWMGIGGSQFSELWSQTGASSPVDKVVPLSNSDMQMPLQGLRRWTPLKDIMSPNTASASQHMLICR